MTAIATRYTDLLLKMRTLELVRTLRDLAGYAVLGHPAGIDTRFQYIYWKPARRFVRMSTGIGAIIPVSSGSGLGLRYRELGRHRVTRR